MGTVGETLLGFHMCELCGISLAHVQHVDEIQSSGTRLQRNGLILIELWTKHTGQFAYPVIILKAFLENKNGVKPRTTSTDNHNFLPEHVSKEAVLHTYW